MEKDDDDEEDKEGEDVDEETDCEECARSEEYEDADDDISDHCTPRPSLLRVYILCCQRWRSFLFDRVRQSLLKGLVHCLIL